MAMKYKKLWGNHISMSKSLNFKWEWQVEYHSKSYDGKDIRHTQICRNRAVARQVKFTLQNRGHTQIKVKRRLVQANWEDYNDSFGWNAGRGKR